MRCGDGTMAMGLWHQFSRSLGALNRYRQEAEYRLIGHSGRGKEALHIPDAIGKGWEKARDDSGKNMILLSWARADLSGSIRFLLYLTGPALHLAYSADLSLFIQIASGCGQNAGAGQVSCQEYRRSNLIVRNAKIGG